MTAARRRRRPYLVIPIITRRGWSYILFLNPAWARAEANEFQFPSPTVTEPKLRLSRTLVEIYLLRFYQRSKIPRPLQQVLAPQGEPPLLAKVRVRRVVRVSYCVKVIRSSG